MLLIYCFGSVWKLLFVAVNVNYLEVLYEAGIFLVFVELEVFH